MTVLSEVLPLHRVLLRHARDAFGSRRRIDEQWRPLGFLEPPDLDEACRQSDGLAELLGSLGVQIEWLRSGEEALGLDSIYVRDASVDTPAGAVACRMGKTARAAEPAAHEKELRRLGRGIAGRIETPGTLEGGDTVWLDESTLAVGRGYRTNEIGIAQLQALVPDVEVIVVPLPHGKGPDDVFHLMSMLSPLASDLLLTHSPLLPVPFRQMLLERGFELVEVAANEVETLGCNVLAVAPRVAVVLEGNPETRRRMESAGVEVHAYEGTEISSKGCGGPTCLTRPLDRG